MKADQAKFLAETLGQGLQGEWMHTYKAINAVPDGKKDYKPAGDSRSAWDLAYHLAVCDVGFLNAVATNSFAAFPAEFACNTRADDLAAFQYTSGTTRLLPEAIRHTHRAIVVVMVAALYATGIRPGEEFFCPSSPAWGTTSASSPRR